MLAKAVGVDDRLKCVVGVAEEMPFDAETHDRIYSGGCLHHMVTESAFSEASRVLKRSGRFAAIDPWRAPGYSLGTKVFGKREANVFCRPLSWDRVHTLNESFTGSGVIQHGTLSRYPLIALSKLGVLIPSPWVWNITAVDDRVSSFLRLRSYGSSACVFANT
jgi:SAM-dependent methyltransferase